MNWAEELLQRYRGSHLGWYHFTRTWNISCDGMTWKPSHVLSIRWYSVNHGPWHTENPNPTWDGYYIRLLNYSHPPRRMITDVINHSGVDRIEKVHKLVGGNSVLTLSLPDEAENCHLVMMLCPLPVHLSCSMWLPLDVILWNATSQRPLSIYTWEIIR